MIRYFKSQLKNLPMTILICIVFYGIVTIATSNINSNDIIFDNTNSNLNAGDMQEAIDEVFQHATDYNEIKTTIGDSTLTTTNQTLTGAVNEVRTLANSKLRYYTLTSSNINDTSTDYSIGIGVIDNLGYIKINIVWIGLEFKVTSGDVQVRSKYGNNSWSAWKVV